MEKLRNTLNKVLNLLAGLSMTVMVVLTTYQVIVRYIFNSPSTWSEELVGYLFGWSTMLGATIVSGERGHMNIPVLVDRSSYEQHPLGRTEWIKLYAALVGKDAEAAEFFDQQAAIITQLKDFENTGKTVAFFFVNSDGSIVIRKPTDYIPKMIELAGGRYAFENFVTDQTNTSVSVTMETFYGTAVDADVLIYNSAIEGMIASVSQLTERFPLLNEFKAVQNGQVWCTTQSLFQQSMELADLIVDMNRVFTKGTPAASTLKFLTHVD